MASSYINTASDCSLNRSHDCLLKIYVLEWCFTPLEHYINWLDKNSHMNNGGDCANGCWCVWCHREDIWEEDEDSMTTAIWAVNTCIIYGVCVRYSHYFHCIDLCTDQSESPLAHVTCDWWIISISSSCEQQVDFTSTIMNANLINHVWKRAIHYVHVSMALASSTRLQRHTGCYWKHNPHLEKKKCVCMIF